MKDFSRKPHFTSIILVYLPVVSMSAVHLLHSPAGRVASLTQSFTVSDNFHKRSIHFRNRAYRRFTVRRGIFMVSCWGDPLCDKVYLTVFAQYFLMLVVYRVHCSTNRLFICYVHDRFSIGKFRVLRKTYILGKGYLWNHLLVLSVH